MFGYLIVAFLIAVGIVGAVYVAIGILLMWASVLRLIWRGLTR